MSDKGVLIQDIQNKETNSVVIPAGNMVTNSDYKTELDIPLRKTVDITTAELLALNTTPKVLITTPGAGYAIVVENVYCSLDYNSAAYATNTDLEIRYDGAAAGDWTGAEVTMDSLDAILLLTADAIYRTPWLGSSADTAVTINKGVTAIMGTGDPITGDSPIQITVIYRIIAV